MTIYRPTVAQEMGGDHSINKAPLTYFIRLVKGIMLKGYSATALLPDLLPLIGLAVIVIGVGLKSYRKTLD
ncbi:ABC transporter permease [Klebsiella pneumoniae]|nr:ABC transporter permease [Klebsiella pneumoniae]